MGAVSCRVSWTCMAAGRVAVWPPWGDGPGFSHLPTSPQGEEPVTSVTCGPRPQRISEPLAGTLTQTAPRHALVLQVWAGPRNHSSSKFPGVPVLLLWGPHLRAPGWCCEPITVGDPLSSSLQLRNTAFWGRLSCT